MQDVVVIGAGLAGLTAARTLHRAGQRVQVLEAAPQVGGRVHSRQVQGFTLDAGYQVLFPAYPAVRRQLNLDALDLVPVSSAAVVRRGAQVDVLGDPIRDPAGLWPTLTAGALTLGDKLRVAKLALHLKGPAPEVLLQGPDESTRAYLTRQGFSDGAVQNFFAPFFGGIFLNRELETSARLFRYYFRMLMEGGAALPRAGMGSLPRQLAQELDVTLNVRAHRLTPRGGRVVVSCDAGDLEARNVIVATDPHTARALTGDDVTRGALGSTYLYYGLDARPGFEPERRLILSAGTGLIHNAQWLSQAVPGRAPAGQHLLTVTVLGVPDLTDGALDAAVRAELRAWDPEPVVGSLRTLGVERIPYAQFRQPPGYAARLPGHATALPGVLLASEVTSMSGIQGALESGERAAAILLNDLRTMSRPRGA
ncbi:NAD(P)/FAD-dependent oxidoreductase [Deinococcus ficus]|uniref:Amine oxidase n=1 Tax=Deinococcus ficus TaxID=317577 RepID=A0A221SX53_9DEIO|nr:NAD(P)/FAD-dependent oxidoreductase [Deinococcus ficus]ASN81201.1 amine oxidase [Deinococcus ficus]